MTTFLKMSGVLQEQLQSDMTNLLARLEPNRSGLSQREYRQVKGTVKFLKRACNPTLRTICRLVSAHVEIQKLVLATPISPATPKAALVKTVESQVIAVDRLERLNRHMGTITHHVNIINGYLNAVLPDLDRFTSRERSIVVKSLCDYLRSNTHEVEEANTIYFQHYEREGLPVKEYYQLELAQHLNDI